jgi:hemerythrin superfamily protein
MDALELLENEHDDVQALIVQLAKKHGTEARKVFAELNERIRLHDHLEEEVFYPPLRQEEITREIVLEGTEEHHLVHILLDELSLLLPEDEAWTPKVILLKDLLDKHIRREETDLFPRVRTLWDEDTSRHLGRKMQQLMARWRKDRQVTAATL